MRTFYCFDVNEYYYDMYFNSAFKLYKILEEIFYSKNYDKLNGYRLYRQVVVSFNKTLCNDIIYKKHRLCYDYYNDCNSHYIKRKEEHTKMIISNINIKVISDTSYPSFFEDIVSLTDSIFVCDFDNNDYFWLSKVIKNDRQREITIVK